MDYLFLKPFGLYASSILSIAIVLSGLPARAEEHSPILHASHPPTSEFDSLLNSEPPPDSLSEFSSQNFRIATIGEVAFEKITFQAEPDRAAVEGFAISEAEGPIYLAHPPKQANYQPVELLTESPAPVSIEPSSPPNSVQVDELEPPGSAVELTTHETTKQSFPSDPLAQDEPATQPVETESFDPSPSNRWQFSVEPYFYLPFDVNADITVDGRSTSLDLGLDDILDLDQVFDAGLRLEAQHNRWGFILDGFYVYGEDSRRLGGTFAAGSLLQFARQVAPGRVEQFVQQFNPERLQQFIQRFDPEQIQEIVGSGRQIGLNTPVRVSASGDVSVRQITVDAAVSYRVVDTALDKSPEEIVYPRFLFAPILGVRTNFLRQTIEVDTIRIENLPIADDVLPPINRTFRYSKTLVSPLVGAEFGLGLSERWMLGLRSDVSGFNIGADENWTWNLLASVQYRLSRLASLRLAYHFSSFDFEDGEGFARAKLGIRQNDCDYGPR
ncbi:hypothetical protein [Leptolyngbya sp. 7M]|uniref:hypothetical protein n=1 Tax=Leptolyngbya sp. 7M TaxID=2812896 RepID=UPI001B8C08B5|nr:hypothetical protein [Leptolyngbya sp. 7M]QYO68216.1 hypothetical protein JVX88_16485 [Leptolyngbya sp. 7M]